MRDPVAVALTRMVWPLFLHPGPTRGPSVVSPIHTQGTPLPHQGFLLDTQTPVTASTVAVQAASQVKVSLHVYVCVRKGERHYLCTDA